MTRLISIRQMALGRMGRMVRRYAPLLIAAVAGATPVVAQTPGLAMLNTLERGQWQLVDRDSASQGRSLCVNDLHMLLQLQHQGAQCSRYVIDDEPNAVTVHYTCPGAGHGRTTIRKETSRLVQIDTQGIAAGAPFSYAYEARRTGSCS